MELGWQIAIRGGFAGFVAFAITCGSSPVPPDRVHLVLRPAGHYRTDAVGLLGFAAFRWMTGLIITNGVPPDDWEKYLFGLGVPVLAILGARQWFRNRNSVVFITDDGIKVHAPWQAPVEVSWHEVAGVELISDSDHPELEIHSPEQSVTIPGGWTGGWEFLRWCGGRGIPVQYPADWSFSPEALAILDQLAANPSARRNRIWAMVWMDELPPETSPVYEMVTAGKAFDHLLAYRMSLVLGEELVEYRPVWEQVVCYAPNWPGLREERRGHRAARLLAAQTRLVLFEERQNAWALAGCATYVCCLIAPPVGHELAVEWAGAYGPAALGLFCTLFWWVVFARRSRLVPELRAMSVLLLATVGWVYSLT